MVAGQDPATFRCFTLREIDVIIEAASLRDARLAWQAATYARFAYHKPNDMPECPGAAPVAAGPGTQSAEADGVYVRAWMRAMHNNARMTHGG